MRLKRMPFAGSETLWLLRSHIKDVRHPAELGKRTRLHLSHQVGAMHLHCTLREAHIFGDLVVQATRHDMEHDLTLAGAEHVETRLEHGKCSFTLFTGAIANEAVLDRVKKILIAERFCKELDCTPLHRLHAHRHVGMSCNENDRHLPVRSGKVALKVKTASPRHPHIEYEARRALRAFGPEKLGNRGKLTGL